LLARFRAPRLRIVLLTFFNLFMFLFTPAKWLLLVAALGQATVAAAQSPTVLARTPGRNACNVSPAAAVSLTFSEAISATTSPFVRIYGERSIGKRTFTTTGSGTANISYQPVQRFAPGELVQVTVPASMRSAATNSTGRYETFQFRVASSPAAATFTYPPNVPVGQLPVAIAAADLDGDGDVDFVSSNRGGNSLSVRLNIGLGRFTAGQEISLVTTTFVNPQPIGIQLADMDGDGDFDIVQANTDYNAASVNVFTNAGNATFSLYSNRILAGIPGLLNVLDVNGDGSPDVVLPVGNAVSGGSSSSTVTVLENNSYGALSLGQQAPTQAYYGLNLIATGDMDNDGDLDALVSRDNGGLGVFANQISYSVTGSAQYGLNYNAALGLPNVATADIAVGDLDGDGDLDLVRTPTASGQTVNVHFNNGQGAFDNTTFQTLTTAASTDGLVLADMDGDGDLDLIASNYAAGSISLSLNNGLGIMGTPRNISVGTHPTRPTVADLNGDGRLDILVPLADNNTVLLLLNQALPTASRPAFNAIADLFPNPAHDRATLQLAAGTGPVAVRVRDVLGREVALFPLAAPAPDGKVLLALPGLRTGVYQVQTTAADGRTSTRSLAIE
jgi:hypothetical protein